MGCCGGKNSKRCCLCGEAAKKFYPWGTKRTICWRCKEKMDIKVVDMTYEIYRVTTLLKREDPKFKGKIKL